MVHESVVLEIPYGDVYLQSGCVVYGTLWIWIVNLLFCHIHDCVSFSVVKAGSGEGIHS